MRKSIEQLFQEFMYESEFVKQVSPATLKSYTQAFTLLGKVIPDLSIETLSSQTITQFFKSLNERKRIVGKGIIKSGIKKSTVATYWRKLNVFFTWLTQKKYIRSNPLEDMRCSTPAYEERKYLQKEDIEKLITAIHLHHNNNLLLLKRNLAILYLFLFCGIRKEELLLLQIRDIDFQKKLLTIRAENSKVRRSRQLPIHSSLLLHLKDYLESRKSYTSPYLLVSSTKDARLCDGGLKHLIQTLKDHSGVSFHPHQLRHTFAVNFLKANNNIAKLRQLLGHKSILMTMVYLRCLPTEEMRTDIENLHIDSFL